VNLFPDELLGDFGEIGGECAAKFLKLGPENPIDKAAWRFDDDCLHVHPPISKGPDPVPTAKRDKELSGPHVSDREFDFLRRLAGGGIPKEYANAIGCRTSSGAAFSPAVPAPAKSASIFRSLSRSRASAEFFPVMVPDFS
jgi:hypothetical protein